MTRYRFINSENGQASMIEHPAGEYVLASDPAAQTLTWREAKPDVPGFYLWRDRDRVMPVEIIADEDDPEHRYWTVRGYNLNWSLNAMPPWSEWAGPLPTPTPREK